MKAEPKVSVVIPVHNREALIGRAVTSILNQQFEDFELLIIDDGSTDGTTEVIRSFTDKRIILANMPANCGSGIARNLGIRLARGEFIATMDSDDVALPQRLGRQVAFLNDHQDIAIVGSHAIKVEGEQRVIVRHSPDDGVLKARLLLLNGSSIFHPTTMLRKAFLENTGILYGSDPTDEDHRLWIDAMVNGARFSVIQEPLLEYHRHAANITHPNSPAFKGHYQRKTPMRARLLSLFFQDLTSVEAVAIAKSMEEGRQHSFEDICHAISAIKKAGRQNVFSYYGESRKQLKDILLINYKRLFNLLYKNAKK